MTTFVGAEYIIGNVLIAQKKRNFNAVTFEQVRTVGRKLQEYCNNVGIDAVFVTSGDNISIAIDEFPEYFEMVKIRTDHVVQVKPNILISQLESRFVGYLPLEVLTVMAEKISILLTLPMAKDKDITA